MGVDVVTFEIRDDPKAQNLADADVQRALLARVAGGEFDAVFLAPPCASFCLALQPVLRSRFEPEGMRPIPREWAAYLRRHNALVQFSGGRVYSCRPVRCCVVHREPRVARGGRGVLAGDG